MSRAKIMFLDERDSAHNNSFLALAYWLQNDKISAHIYIMPVYQILFKNSIMWIKNPTYKWSNSDWRKWIYKLTGFDDYCGTNGDQLEPTLIYALITSNFGFIRKIRNGLIVKGGFFGNNLEWSILRPRIWSIIARSFNFKPLWWFLDIFEAIMPIEKYPATNRSIRDYIFLIMCQITYTETIWTKILKFKHRKTYWPGVFNTYFCQSNNRIIYEQMPLDLLE
jgi:hypothetical protein